MIFEDILESLMKWRSATNERQKLQHSYLVIIALGLIIAGLISLIEPDLGHKIAKIALFALFAFVANALTWNLLNSAVISKLPARTKKK